MWYGFEIGFGIAFGLFAGFLCLRLLRHIFRASIGTAASLYALLSRVWHWLGRVLPSYPEGGWSARH